jgi:excisionase family DNA binding protein
VIERHYKTRELAELLGLHPETIRRAAQRGQLESVRIGLDRIYSESAVQRWLDANRECAPIAPGHLNGHTGVLAIRREAR